MVDFQDYVWARIIQFFGDYGVYFLDIEVEPAITKEVWTNEHKIIAVGVGNMDETTIFMGTEEQILSDLNTYFYQHRPTIIAGYGITWLDIPFLIYKIRQYSKKHVRWRKLLETLERTPILELMYPTSNYMHKKFGERKYWKLVEVAQKLGLPKEKFTEGIYKDKRKLKEYLSKDIDTIRKLFKILKEEYLSKL